MAEDSIEPATRGVSASERTDRSPWNWLLFIPIVVPLLTVLHKADAPRCSVLVILLIHSQFSIDRQLIGGVVILETLPAVATVDEFTRARS